MRDLTGGQSSLRLSAQTLGQLIDALDHSYPGVKDRLCEFGQLKEDIMAFVDDQPAKLGLMQPVYEYSEVRFLPIVSGG